MEPIPLPSQIHYELLLQMLEQQTLFASNQQPDVKKQIQQLIVTLRKALAQQKQIEASCKQQDIDFEHRWSLNSMITTPESSSDVLPLPLQSNG